MPQPKCLRRVGAVAWIVLAGLVLAAPGSCLAAADERAGAAPLPRKNPLSRNPEAVQAGRHTYLERCAVCHGQNARGSMAANLVRSRYVARGSDAALFQLLVEGIPGTDMPPQPDLSANQVWQVVAYLHNLARPGLQPPVPGDAVAGREVFRKAGCAKCHAVDGQGGFWGPALDSVAARMTSDAIRRSVLEPGATVSEGFRPVEIVHAEHGSVAGLLKNEDTFSVQVLTADGTYVSMARGEITAMRKGTGSPMPADFGRKLGREELQDLLAFLDRQRDPFVPFQRGFGNY